MKELADKEKKQIGKNLKGLRKKLNITIDELSNAVILSKSTIKDIESGKAKSIDNIISVAYFLGITLREAADSDYQMPLEPELRNKVIVFHKKHKIADSYKLLNKQPAIKTIVIDRFIPNGYLEKPVYVKELIELYYDDYRHTVSASSLSNELKKLVDDDILIITNPEEKYHRYKRK